MTVAGVLPGLALKLPGASVVSMIITDSVPSLTGARRPVPLLAWLPGASSSAGKAYQRHKQQHGNQQAYQSHFGFSLSAKLSVLCSPLAGIISVLITVSPAAFFTSSNISVPAGVCTGVAGDHVAISAFSEAFSARSSFTVRINSLTFASNFFVVVFKFLFAFLPAFCAHHSVHPAKRAVQYSVSSTVH